MRILHVASFVGNIGDNASHLGLRYLISDVCDTPILRTQLEIRRFYQRYSRHDRARFDDSFAEQANAHDLVVFGGGGFLDFSIEGSSTGTTIDIDEAVLGKIRTPIVISSVGCVPHQAIPPGNVERLRRFLDLLLDRGDVVIGLRNDGSADAMQSHLGGEYALETILDNGFFFRLSDVAEPLTKNPYIAINVATDQIAMSTALRAGASINDVYGEIAIIADYILNDTDHDIVFVPHIYKDLQGIAEVLTRIDDFLVRTRIAVAPHVQGDAGCQMLMSVYAQAELTLGMRFHANVCAVAMGCEVVGIAALPRIAAMFHSIGRGDHAVLTEPGFAQQIIERLRALDLSAGPQWSHSSLEAASREFHARGLDLAFR